MATLEDSQVSPALKSFLALKDEEDDDHRTIDTTLPDDELAGTPIADPEGGLEEQIAKYADSDILRAILDKSTNPADSERQCELQLREAERASVQDYISEADNLVVLHAQISTCDEILASMEEMLGRFQGDLGNISTEIRSLQEQSQSMSVKLRNRKALEQKLGAFLENIAIPAGLIEGIVQSEVDEGFQEHLAQLHRKLEFVTKDETVRETAAFQDVAPELERLRIKALTKVREFLMTRIYALRKPKTNIQILQQNVLLKYKFLVGFLRDQGREVLAEVRSAYIETLSRVLSSHFRAYLGAIERLQESNVGPVDVIGDTSPAALGGVMSNLFTRSGQSQRKNAVSVFEVGDRVAILHRLDQAAIIPHVAESENKRYPYEVLFRSIHKLLMDTSTSEYLFCLDFFQDESVYYELMQPSLGVIESSLAAQLQEIHELVGLLLLIRINSSHQLIMNKRRVPCLDGYLDRVNLLLWPRFKVVFDNQLMSLKSFNVAAFSEDVKLHEVTRRYATLTASLLLLNSDLQDNQLEHNLDRLRYTAMDLLTKLSRQFKHRRSGIVFLVNNFTYIVELLHEAAAKASQMAPAPGATPPPQMAPLGMTGAETLKSFEDQSKSCTSLYITEALQQHFGALMAFVKQEEVSRVRSQTAPDQTAPGFGATEGAPIAKDFSAKWNAALEALNREVMRDFKSSNTGREVLKAALSHLLQVYTQFLDQMKKGGSEGASLIRDAVTVPSLLYEIRRYTRT